MSCGPAADCALPAATHPLPGRACRSLTACETVAPRHALSPWRGDTARRARTLPGGFRSVRVTQPPAGPIMRKTRNGSVCRLSRAVHRRPALPRPCRGPCRGPYDACGPRGKGEWWGEPSRFCAVRAGDAPVRRNRLLWGACGAVYAFALSLGPVGRKRHAGNTRTRRALCEGGGSVEAFLHSVWGRGTDPLPAPIRRPTSPAPATIGRARFEVGLGARVFLAALLVGV